MLFAANFAQGVLFQHNPTAFIALLRLIGGMRKMGSRNVHRRPVQYIRLSRTDLTDSMVRMLVAEILKLPPRPRRPLAHPTPETLELQKVGNRLSIFRNHATLTCVLRADDIHADEVARAARGVRIPRH